MTADGAAAGIVAIAGRAVAAAGVAVAGRAAVLLWSLLLVQFLLLKVSYIGHQCNITIHFYFCYFLKAKTFQCVNGFELFRTMTITSDKCSLVPRVIPERSDNILVSHKIIVQKDLQ
jgi:hypothetical protein